MSDEKAFPGQYIDRMPHTGEQVVREQWFGMTLRDYFAAKAMASMIVSGLHFDGSGDAETYSKWSYQYADAMLEARKAKEGE